jgi:hypothetical protein
VSCVRLVKIEAWFVILPTLHRFPTGTSKVVNLNDIKDIKVYKPRPLLQTKSWGMATDFDVW